MARRIRAGPRRFHASPETSAVRASSPATGGRRSETLGITLLQHGHRPVGTHTGAVDALVGILTNLDQLIALFGDIPEFAQTEIASAQRPAPVEAGRAIGGELAGTFLGECLAVIRKI